MSFIEKLNHENADTYIKDMLSNISEVLLVKSKEYVRNDDRMHNFNQAARKKDLTREQVLDGMRLKHEVSIDDIRRDISEGVLPSRELLDEKFTDIINYYILEYMSIRHRIDKQENE